MKSTDSYKLDIDKTNVDMLSEYENQSKSSNSNDVDDLIMVNSEWCLNTLCIECCSCCRSCCRCY